MEMAVRDSVTVSMAALTMGMRRRRLRVSWAVTSTWRGRTLLSAGSSKTSSNVSASGTFASSMPTPESAARRRRKAAHCIRRRTARHRFCCDSAARVPKSPTMQDGPPPGGKPPGGGKRPAVGLQIKLPCAGTDDVKVRYGEDLRQNRFFIRTKTPRAKETLVRLEAQLSTGVPAFRAAAVVIETSDTGMRLQLLAVDDAGRDLITALGGKPPPPLKIEPPRPTAPPPPVRPAITSLPGIKAPPPAEKPAPPPPVVP